MAKKSRRRKNKIGRNDKCPCGSGKKYKRCCLGADEQRRSSELAAAQPPSPSAVIWSDDEDDIDDVSNSVLPLIADEKWEQAEQICRELAERWPDQVDQFHRLAMVREAQGRYDEAAALFRQSADFARTHIGFDEESVQAFLDDAARAEGKLEG